MLSAAKHPVHLIRQCAFSKGANPDGIDKTLSALPTINCLTVDTGYFAVFEKKSC
jgi:hypothetical protein